MNLGKMFNKESVLDSPFTPRAKPIAPVVAAGAIAAGASLLSNIFGSRNQSNTNETNLKIARETNQMNYQMMKEQNEFNLDMWNKQNEYNSPSQVVQRLKSAGINPASAFGIPTPASSLQSSQPHAMVAPQMEAFKPDFSGIGQAAMGAIDAWNQSRLASAEVKQKEALTNNAIQEYEVNRSLNPHRIKFLQEQSKREGFLGDLARTQLAYEQAVNGMKISQVFQDFRLSQQQYKQMQQNIELGELQKGLYQVQLSFAPRLNEAQLQQYYDTCKQIRANIGLINANALLTYEQRLHEIEKRTSTIIDNGLKGFDFKIKDAVKDYIIDQQISESDRAHYEAGNAAKFFYGGEVGRRLPLSGYSDSNLYNGRVMYRHRPIQKP